MVTSITIQGSMFQGSAHVSLFCSVTMFADQRWYTVGNMRLGSVCLEKQIRITSTSLEMQV